MPDWTANQQAAIEALGSNLLVAASAGSGKTAVLVQRILHLVINQQVDIDHFLIVTFTQAAAAEMRERIGAALSGAIEERPEDKHLRRQINILNHASISTIHAFCNEVVRNYFHLIEINPRYRVADQTEAGLLKLEVLEELLESEYEQGDPTYLQLADSLSAGRDDTSFQDTVLKIYDFIYSQPDPLGWLRSQVESFKVDADELHEGPWMAVLYKIVSSRLKAAQNLLNEALNQTRLPGGSLHYQETLLDDIVLIQQLTDSLASQNGDALFTAISSTVQPRLKSVEKDADKRLAEEVKEMRAEAWGIIKQIREEFLPRAPQEMLHEMNQIYPFMRALYEVVEKFSGLYSLRKTEKGLLDFHDLEHYALSILRFPEAADNYRQRFEYIFVDEYQDSNPVQEALLNNINRADNLFMVGDVKQSIYRFRLSDPGLFIAKYKSFDHLPGSINRRIILDSNFRCSEPIIEAVNCIFSHIMSEELGEVTYDDEVKLVCGSQEQPLTEPAVELRLIERDVEIDSEDDPLEEAGLVEIEARLTARRIKELLAQEIYDTRLEERRPVQYRDMVVLMRATQNWAGIFQEVFMAEGIPCYADANTGYFEALEVRIFLDLLRLIDNKRQDIPLVGVMRSPILSFSVDDLISVRSAKRDGTFYEAITAYMENKHDELTTRLQQMIARLDSWKREARMLPMDNFIWKLLLETGFYHYAGAMPGGIQRQANLRILHDRARQFQNTSFKGLFQFLRFVDQVKASSGDMDMARTLGENDNVVRIMSIHKSKGLEFPIVIVAGLGRKFNIRDSSAQLLLHKDLGLGPRLVDLNLRASTDTLARNIIRAQIRMENLSEEMRILYVACTRPKNKLILIGSIRGLDSTIKRWAREPDPHQLSRARCFMDWLGPVVLRHPEGEVLRSRLNKEWHDQLAEDDCQWQVVIHSRLDLGDQIANKQFRSKYTEMLWDDFESIPPNEDEQMVFARLNWCYPFKDSETMPSKLFVTQIREELDINRTRLALNIPEVIDRPHFMEKTPQVTSLQRGSAMHTVMQHLGRKKMTDWTMENLNELLVDLVDHEILTPQEADAVNLLSIYAFIDSPLGERISRANRVFREAPFNLVCSASEVILGADNNDEKLLIQGVVDLFFEEEDGIVLVDYKTDRVSSYNQNQLVKHYRGQLEWYRQALEKIKGRPVKEMYLYFFDSQELVQLGDIPS